MPLVLALALLLDLAFGEPPNRWHPVAWVGRALGWAGGRGPRRGAWALLAYGGILTVAASLAVGLLARGVAHATGSAGWPGLLLQAWLVKCTFSLRGLVTVAREVRRRLEAEDLPGARERVGRDLVSRPTGSLSPGQVASATVESVAENLTDSLVAPLFFFLLGGLPAAWAYRVVNTADAMWGYREGDLEYFGKAAARLDDLLNWGPARMAGLALVLGAWIVGEAATDAWRTMWREHGRVASPNAGWTMAAMAGALGVALEKPGAYRLGSGALPTGDAIGRALRVVVSASGLAMAAAVALAIAWR